MDESVQLIEETERILLAHTEAINQIVKHLLPQVPAQDTATRQKLESVKQIVEQLQAGLTSYGQALRKELGELHERLAETTARPLAPPRPTTGDDRRTTPRRHGNLVPVLVSNPQVTTDILQGWVLDRSTGGLRLLTDEPIAAGSMIRVQPAKSPSRFRWISLYVRSCRPQGNNWVLGCQFQEKLPWSDLRMFGYG